MTLEELIAELEAIQADIADILANEFIPTGKPEDDDETTTTEPTSTTTQPETTTTEPAATTTEPAGTTTSP